MAVNWRELPRGVRLSVVTIAAITLLVIVFITLFNWNWVKPYLEDAVTERTGRQFRIAGDLDVRLGWPTRVSMEQVSFANAPWAREPQMLTAEGIDFSIRLWRLLAGRITLPQVHLDEPFVALEIAPDARTNWTLTEQQGPRGARRAFPVIGQLQIDDGEIRFDDAVRDTHVRLTMSSSGSVDQDTGMKLSLNGRYKQQPIEAHGTAGSLLSVQEQAHPFPINIVARAGNTHATAAGTITGLAQFSAANLKVRLRGHSIAQLNAMLPISLPLPETPPYDLTGRLIRDGEHWRFHDFEGRLGDSDLSGDADLRYHRQRASVVAKIKSNRLDMDDLAGLIGAPPQTGPGETASPEQKREAEALKKSKKLLPDKTFKVAALRNVDADVRYRAGSIRSRKTPIEDLDMHIILKGGKLQAKPLNFGVADGNIVSTVSLDARRDVLAMQSDFQFKRIDLGKLFPTNQTLQRSVGTIGGRALLTGNGNSFAKLLGNADGTLGFAMRDGEVSNLLLEVMGLDGGEIIKFLFKGDKDVKIRCALADFDVQDGVMRSRSTLMDTKDTNIYVHGSINLRSEELDLKLQPLPKDFSLLSLRAPLNVKGRLKDPQIRPNKQALLKTGLAAILGALAGPAALIPLIETGPGENADCKELVAQVEQHAKTTAAAGRPKSTDRTRT
jgi:AsmA family protein